MADEDRIFKDKAIRDTSTHNSDDSHAGEMEPKTVFIENGLNQQVTLQLQGTRCNGSSSWANIGSSFNVAANTDICKDITTYMSMFRVTASCSTAPTTGNLDVWILKMGR